MPRPAPFLLAVSLALSCALSGCTGATNSSNSTSDRATVVTTLYPLEWVARRIAGEHAEVTSLAVPGAEPHDLQLKPRQVAQLSAATVVFYESGLQPEVDKAIRNDAPQSAVDAAKLVDLKPASASHDSDDHDHDHGEDRLDPHFWLDPTLLAAAASGFSARLQEADPAHKSAYATNTAQLLDQLATLDNELAQGLARCTLTSIVVSHDAFEYLGRRYGLTVHPIAALSPDAEPSPHYLQQLADVIKEEQITTVFHEELAPAANARTLAQDLNLRSAVLDPLEAVDPDSIDDYPSVMRRNLAALRQANQCS